MPFMQNSTSSSSGSSYNSRNDAAAGKANIIF